MNCPKCGAENISGSTFCIKCGTNLIATQPINNVEAAPIQNQAVQSNYYNVNMNQNQSMQQPMNNQTQNNYQQPANNLNYLKYIIAILMKPTKTFKEEESKLNNSKTSFLFALIITLAMTVINLVKTIFSTVRVSSYSWTEGYIYSWEWENLKDIKWFEVIGKNFLIFACILFAIALVFYLGSLVIKKQSSFIRTLSIATTSVIPAIVGAMILSPLASLIWEPLGVACSIVGGVYSIIILYELINKELNLDGDMKIYFNLICLGILAIAGYYVYMKLFMGSVTDELNDMLNWFK